MNACIPVNNQKAPPGFVCNVTLRHIGPSVVHGHTPPRSMDIQCPCLDCVAEAFPSDSIVLGPVWCGHDEPVRTPEEMVGLYDKNRLNTND